MKKTKDFIFIAVLIVLATIGLVFGKIYQDSVCVIDDAYKIDDNYFILDMRSIEITVEYVPAAAAFRFVESDNYTITSNEEMDVITKSGRYTIKSGDKEVKVNGLMVINTLKRLQKQEA